MNKILFVGDPHVQPSNIEESDRLMQFVLEKGKETGADILILPGDLFHTHAVIRMEVLNFWSKWISIFADAFRLVHLIVGNHDQIGDRQREGAMSALDSFSALKQNVRVWTQPGVFEGLGFIPYTSNHDKFIESAKNLQTLGAKRLFCHQTFDGSKYDNGFYAPDGIDTKLLPPFDEVVSGHIHTEQLLDSVFYPGTARWDSLSDANQKKGIWVSDSPKRWTKIETDGVCIPIVKKTIEEKACQDCDFHIKDGTKTVFELVGSSSWIAKTAKKLKGRCRIVARPTDSVERKKTQSSIKSIFEYMENYKNKSSDKEGLRKYLENLCQ